ncbi:MAG: threonylcarbamoyl-AMP synthase [Ignavibacteriales bacterium]|nr:threonylcarbamoyl-AMP synthase [Ignavibacteriales bacterium]
MGTVVKINPSRIQSRLINDVASVIERGGVILYPTDTIYGLGCDAFKKKAVERIFQIKKRSPQNPALVLAGSNSMVEELVADISDSAANLMKHFWPGPLTIVFRACKGIHPLLVSRTGKIGIRIPDNNFCLKLLTRCQTPIVSTSANISGEVIMSTFNSLRDVFLEKVDMLVDGGDLKSTLPSTVVDVSEEKLIILREGIISLKEIQRLLV